MIKRIVLFISILFPSLCAAQGAGFQSVLLGPTGRPLAGAQVTVCASTATGLPCTPTSSIFADPALTQPISNPIITDSLGNWGFWAAPGNYQYSVTGNGVTSAGVPTCTSGKACPYLINIPCVVNVSCLTSPTTASIVINSPGSFTDNGTFSATGQASISNPCLIDGLIFVSTSGCYTTINLAVAALPSTGGTIYLPPGVFQPTGGTVTISTPNTVIVGAGSSRSSSIGAPGATVIRGGTSANPVIVVSAGAWNVRLYHLQIDNEGGTNLATMGVQIVGGAFHFTAEDVGFGNTQKFTTAGVASTNAAISAFIVFRDCFFNGAAPINLDIDRANGLILDHTTLVANANTTTANIRLGTTSLVTGTWIGNGSDIELQSQATGSAVDVLLVKTASTVIRDSFIETVIDSVAGAEGQLAINVSASTNNQLLVEGNYFQGNAHSNYAIATSGSPSNIYINQNEFTGQLSAAMNPSSGQTHVVWGDNYFTGGTPVGAFAPAIQWIDSSAQPNFGKPIVLNGSTSGSVTHAVPAVAGSNTITDPAATGIGVIDPSSTFTGATAPTGVWSCTNVTPVTVNANVTTDQNLMACTIPAGTLNRIGRSLNVSIAGVYSTPAASVSQMTLKIKLCTVSGCGSGTVITPINIQSTALGSIQVTNDNFSFEGNLTTQTAGASSAYEAHGSFPIDLQNVTTAADSVFGDTNTATVGTIDSTAQLFLQVTFAFSTASASNAATQRQLVVQTVN